MATNKRSDPALAKSSAVTKPAETRIEDLTGIFAVLSQQHADAGALLTQIVKTPGQRAELWPKIRVALVTHERAEMRVLYPELRMHDSLRALANRHDAEASELERMVHDLDTVDMTSSTFGNLVERLGDAVKRHAAEEETDIFPRAQSLLGRERAKQLEPKFLATQKSLEESS